MPRIVRRIAFLTWFVVVLPVATMAACRGPKPARMHAYADGTAGLQSFMSDFAAAAAHGPASLATEMGTSLVLPDPDLFFSSYYPAEIADRLIAEYRARPPAAAALIDLLRTQQQNGLRVFRVERFDQVADENAVGYQEYALKEQTKLLPLYSLRAQRPDTDAGAQHLFNFVYVDGAWKYAGPMKSIKEGLMNDPRLDALASLRAKARQSYFNQGTVLPN